jgi:phosphoglycolate phosphatase
MRFRTLIFDLDGTLIDSAPGIQSSCAAAAARVLPGTPLPDLTPRIGPPIRTMFSRLWPGLGAEPLDRLVAEFRRHYDSEGCLASRPYDGADQMLAALKRGGAGLHLLTNKPSLPTQRILERLGWRPFFTSVLTPDAPERPFARKEDGARLLRDAGAFDPSTACLIGDALDDALAARACGIPFVAAAYGYGDAARQREHPPLLAAESLFQLAEVLLKQGGSLP